MVTHFKKLIFLSFYCVTFASSFAQDVTISITPLPPFSPALKYYTDMTSQRMQIFVRNNTSQSIDLKFSAKIISNTGIDIHTNPNYIPSSPFTLNAFENHLMTDAEMDQMFDKNNIVMSGFDYLQVIRTGGLPEGIYTICMTAYDYNSIGQNSPRTNPNGNCSNPIIIQYLDPPIISSVNGVAGCGNQISNAFSTNILTLNWMPPAMIQQQGLNIIPKYKLFIHEVPLRKSSDDQIFSETTPFLIKDDLPNYATSAILNVPQEGFRPGVQYIFRIQVYDENENVIFKNNGYSATCKFTLLDNQNNAGGNTGNPPNSSFSSRIIYPAAGDTIPFQNYPIVATIGAANSNVERIKVLGTCNEPNSSWQYLSDTLYFQTPQAFRGTGEYRLMYRTYNRWAWYRGVEFEPKATTYIKQRSQDIEQVVEATSNMVFGMGQPVLIRKVQLDSTKKRFRIEYLPMRRPSKILPDSMAALAREAGFDDNHKLMIREKMFIEIDRDAQFLAPKRVAWVELNYDYLIKNPNLHQITSDLFTTKTIDISLPENQHYFARIGYLSDPTDTNSTPYVFSKEFHLNQLADGCMLTHYDGMRIGAEVCIGAFTMKIKQLNTSTEPYEGIGAIKVPFFDHNLLVDFTELKVTESGYVYNGKAQARQGDHTRNLIPNNLNVAAARTLLQSDANRDLIFRSSRQNTDDTAGSTLPYLVTSWNHLGSFYIWKLVFHTNRVEMFAGMSLQLSGTQGEALDFVSFDYNLTPSCTNMGLMRLELVSNNKIPIPGIGQIHLKPNLNNRNPYIRFDCTDGIKDGLLYADLIPNPRLIKLATNQPRTGDTIITPIEIALDKSRNMVFEAQLPNFIALDMDDFVFQSCSLVVDNSTTINLSSMNSRPNPPPVTWTGRQANDLWVALPRWMGGGTRRVGLAPPTDDRVYLNLSTFDLSGEAPSFEIFKQKVRSFSDGYSWGTFNYAIDTFKLKINEGIVTNSFLSGRLKTPISQDTNSTRYKLSIAMNGSHTEFSGRVTLGNNIKFEPLHGAKLEILPSSSLNLEMKQDNIEVSLNLSGNMIVEVGKSANTPAKIAVGLNFQNMTLKNTGTNAFSMGAVQITTASVLGYGFGQTANSDQSAFELITRNTTANSTSGSSTDYLLKLKGKLAMPGFDFGKVAGTVMVGFRQTPQGVFTPLPPEFTDFKIEGSMGPLNLSGNVTLFENDENWGTGFSGNIDCGFNLCSGSIAIKTELRIGQLALNTNKRQYWYAGGTVNLPTPVPVIPNILNAKSFMIGVGGNISFENQIYKVNRGNQENKLFRGGIELESVVANQFKIRGALTANISESWGVNSIAIDANLAMLGSGYHLEAQSDYEFSAVGNFTIDVVNSKISARATSYLNAFDLIKGSSNPPGIQMGELDLLLSANDWHLHFGKPSRPLSVQILGVKFSSYFMIGNGMEAPVYSPKLLEALNGSLPMQPLNPGSMGLGIAHGANFDINTGDKTFLMFYGSFQMGAGYNVALIKYDQGCNNSATIGLNGWYATGDVYAYLDGKVGMYVDVFCYTGNITLAHLKCGAILMAGTPNPTWISGKAAGSYNVLGGLVKGKFNFEFTLGTVCKPKPPTIETPVANIQLIEDIGPSHLSTNVPLSMKPYFAIRFKNNFVMSVEVPVPGSSNTQIRTFRVKRTISFGKLDQSNSFISLPFSINENSDEDFTQGNISLTQGYFDANTKYRFKVTAWFEEKINNQWVNAVKANGTRVFEEKTVEFSTVRIAVIDPYMIRNQFPQQNRMFVYGTDLNGGFWFQNRTGGLFSPTTRVMNNTLYNVAVDFQRDVQVKYIMRFTDLNNGDVAFTPIYVSRGTDNVRFNTNRLGIGKLYRIDVLRVLQGNNFFEPYITQSGNLRFHNSNSIQSQLLNSSNIVQGIAGNSFTENLVSLNGDSNTVQITRFRKNINNSDAGNNLMGNLIQGLSNTFIDEMYTTHFGTSKFVSFEDKCRRAFVNNSTQVNIFTPFGFITMGSTTEAFDNYDIGKETTNIPQNFRAFKIYPTNQNQFYLQMKDFYLRLNQMIIANKIPYNEIKNMDFFNENTQLFDTLKPMNFLEELVPVSDQYIANSSPDNVPNWLREQQKSNYAFTINPSNKRFVVIIDQVNKIRSIVSRVLANEFQSEGPSKLLGITNINTTNTGQVYRTGNISNLNYPYQPDQLERYRNQLIQLSLTVPTVRFNAGGEEWLYWIHRSETVENQIFPDLNIRPGIHPPNHRNEPFFIYEAFTLPIK